MRIKLAFRHEVLWVEFPDDTLVNVARALHSIKKRRSDIYKRLVNMEGQLQASLTILVNGEHIRYLKDLDTQLSDGDELYIIPNYAGG